jgi:hypothetical protein
VIELVPLGYFVGYECWLVWATYITMLTDYDAFEGERRPRVDPIQARSGQTIGLLANAGTMVTNVGLMLLTTGIIGYVGAVFKSQPIYPQV